MGLAATIKHQCPGRLRLKFSEDCGQEDLKRLVDHLRTGGDVQAAESNLLTRTLLIKARDDEKLQAVLRRAKEEGLFDLHDKKPMKKEINATLLDVRDAVDRFFKEISDNRLDFRTGMAGVMVGLGIRQAFVGKFMPAGLTLVFYALGLLEVRRPEKSSESSK